MNKRYVLGLSMIVLASASIVSNGADEEQNTGLRFVTDESYPDVSPVLAHQVARLKEQSESGTGADISGSSAAGQREAAGKAGTGQSRSAIPACVGPVSFCTPFFRSSRNIASHAP